MAKSVMRNNSDLKLRAEQVIDDAYMYGYEDGKKESTLHCWTTKEIEACEEIKNEAYQRGSEDAWKRIVDVRSKDIECGYNRGLNDAWECARKILDMGDKETELIFGMKFFDGEKLPIDVFSAQEAMQKIKDYERRQKWAEQAKRGKEHRDEIEKMLEGKLAKKCDNCEYKGLGGCTRQAKGYSDLCINFSKYKSKQNEDDYVDAIVKVRVPKWQIGEKVNLYFKDTMSINGICEADKK